MVALRLLCMLTLRLLCMVMLCCRSPESAESDKLDTSMIPKGVTRKIGECGAGEYDNFFKPGRPAQTEGADTTEKSTSTNTGFLEFLQHGHVEAPEHNLSFVYNQVPTGQVFLTVCVFETEDTKNHSHNVTSTTNSAEKVKTQLFRIDIPMKVRSHFLSITHDYNCLAIPHAASHPINTPYEPYQHILLLTQLFRIDIPMKVTYSMNTHSWQSINTSCQYILST